MQSEKKFTTWVEDYSDILFGYLLKHGLPKEIARDILQETFLAAWRNMDSFRAEASVKNWLFVILKNKITDHYRKLANKVSENSIDLDTVGEHFFDNSDHWNKGAYPQNFKGNFESPVETKEFYKLLRTCGNRLKEIQNAVFSMKYIEGLSSEEICKELNISSSNYWVLIHRAKLQLRACLQKNWMEN